MKFRFKKELYSKIALMKAAYNYTDKAFVHLDADKDYFYVDIEMRPEAAHITEEEFANEMLVQSLRHEVYLQTKNIRELLLARAMATTVITEQGAEENLQGGDELYTEDGILKDWFYEE